MKRSWTSLFSRHLKLGFDRDLRNREIGTALAIVTVGLAAVGLPVSCLVHFAGWVTGGLGEHFVPTACFLVGSVALGGDSWAAVRSLPPDTTAERLGTILRGIVCLAYVGGILRQTLQLAAFMTSIYWVPPSFILVAHGLWEPTLLAVAVASFVLPLAVLLANLVPSRIAATRPRLRRVAQRLLLISPIVGSVVILAITSALPPAGERDARVLVPGFTGHRSVYSVHVLDENIWVSLARLHSCRSWWGCGRDRVRAASLTIAKRDRLGRKFFAPDHGGIRILVATVVLGAVVIAVVEKEGYLAAASVALVAVVILSTTKRLAGIVTSPRAEEGRSKLGLPPAWQSMASIGLVLAVLAAPVYVPLGFDLWQGLSSPFRLISDAGGYINFWKYEGDIKVPSVSMNGVFGHGLFLVAAYSASAFAFLILGIIVSFFTRDKSSRKGVGPVLWFLFSRCPRGALVSVRHRRRRVTSGRCGHYRCTCASDHAHVAAASIGSGTVCGRTLAPLALGLYRMALRMVSLLRGAWCGHSVAVRLRCKGNKRDRR